MNKQTAVEFIVDKIFKHSKIPFNKENCPTLFKFIDQAKEMEKEQIESAYNRGTINGIDYPESTLPLTGEQYYDETYK